MNDVQEEIKELPQVEDTAGAGKEITKPAPSGGGDREERRPGRPSERARGELIAEIIKDNHEVLTRLDDEPGRPNERAEFDRHERQVTVERVQKMTYQERLAMWKELNKGAGQERFITLRKVSDLPKNMAMSKEEAVHRGIIEAKKPAKDALYCPYCVTWMPFVSQPWAGYVRCCGCSMSTMDYYIRAYNDLWK